ncbi:MAG: SDR family NAD(P)-dependent oxidoreductase [Thermoflexibacteraceae bacterium]
MKTALITGATSGIGEATARLFAQHQVRLVLCGRRQERLAALQAELGTQTDVHTLAFDVRNAEEVQKAIAELPEDFKNIAILVNNAGNAHGLASIQDGDIADWDAMIDINVKGLLYVSKAIIPNMISAGKGHIINIGSIAGKEVYANGNVYCASKFAVDALTQGMRLDVVKHGIKVTGIHPGMVETEFSLVRFKGDAQRAKQVYQGLQALTAHDVAECIWFAVSRPAHVNIADMIVFPSAQASSTVTHRI